MSKSASTSLSEQVRQHARESYVSRARRRQEKSFAINVGEVHRAVALRNRVPLVCQALVSEKFLQANGLRLLSQSGPPSGQSTTVTYTYEFIEKKLSSSRDPWIRLRGALKNVFVELGGGAAYLRNERDKFYPPQESE